MMTARRGFARRKAGQQGYALRLVIFVATILLVFDTMAAPNIKTEGQREKEKEMIWRGRQYARAVKQYYRKMGRFPTSLEDLTKPKIGSLRFLRQAYKDPMNTQDGSWSLIYVGPGGQLIGSLKPRPNLQVGGLTPQGPAGTQPASPGNPPATSGNPVSADQGTDTSSDADPPIPSDDASPIIGGNIIGVGSKINRKSVIVYDHAKNYRLFEFIWDPSKDMLGVG